MIGILNMKLLIYELSLKILCSFLSRVLGLEMLYNKCLLQLAILDQRGLFHIFKTPFSLGCFAGIEFLRKTVV